MFYTSLQPLTCATVLRVTEAVTKSKPSALFTIMQSLLTCQLCLSRTRREDNMIFSPKQNCMRSGQAQVLPCPAYPSPIMRGSPSCSCNSSHDSQGYALSQIRWPLWPPYLEAAIFLELRKCHLQTITRMKVSSWSLIVPTYSNYSECGPRSSTV